MIRIDMMRKEDVEQVAVIEEDVFSQPWSKQSFLDAIANPNTLYLVAKDGEEIVGYLGIWKALEEGDITNVAVHPDRRRQGIAAMLMAEAKTRAKEEGLTALTLEVRSGNEAAIRLYKKQGFDSAGIRPGFYEHPKEDAVIMWNYSL